jgi:hypothetical protein
MQKQHDVTHRLLPGAARGSLVGAEPSDAGNFPQLDLERVFAEGAENSGIAKGGSETKLLGCWRDRGNHRGNPIPGGGGCGVVCSPAGLRSSASDEC